MSSGHAIETAPAQDGAPTAARPRRAPTSLKWRIAVLTAALLVAFAALLSGTVLIALNASLQRSQEAALREDADRIKELFRNPVAGAPAVPRSYGGIFVSVFDLKGQVYQGLIPLVPTEEVVRAGEGERVWSGHHGDYNLRALIQRGSFLGSPAYIVVAARTDYIRDASNAVAVAVAVVSLLLVLLALAAGYWAASFGLRPLVRVAEQARRLDETNLAPLQYDGPRDELGLLTTTLNQMVSRLRRAFDAQKVFLAETSHELRTPLTALEGYLHRAIKETPSPGAREPLEDALRLSRTMTRLVSDLLQLSRGDLVQEWVPHLVDLGVIAANAAREFPGVRCDCPAERAELIGDPDRLTQLTRNLVANAVRAAGRPEGVEVSVRRAGDRVELHVRDEGPGIPPDVLPHIFAKFYRGPQGGSGLGLAIAAQIVRVHKGEIHVY
ncbi:MAG TPA: HAMP domain-containing sensor histidine kinase, partial [Deinococcales bacterium]|nr:HAMP domain-containing sensor histidine kinase [Deinococcales bacterium]